jgi:predicted GH43/DUF377 family glycosyl hydrolase
MEKKYRYWVCCLETVFLSLVVLSATAQAGDMPQDWSKWVQQVPLQNKFADSGYYVWCGSVVKGEDRKYYMFYSRWPHAQGYEAWPAASEIALAVSDKPEGPFRHKKVVLPARGTAYWDGTATHNPAVIVYKGRYYLYYMGTSYPQPLLPGEAYTPNWWRCRNTQRIGVAVSNRPDGEWTRYNKPVLDVAIDSTAWDALLVSNPAPAVYKDSIVLVYKQVSKSAELRGGKVTFGVAFAASPLGPFAKHPNRIFEPAAGTKEWMVAEDPFVWHYNHTFYAIVRDVTGSFSGEAGALTGLYSADAIRWQPMPVPKVIGYHFVWQGGLPSASKLERPWLLFEQGKPKYLFGATRADVQQTNSFNVAIPLKPIQ